MDIGISIFGIAIQVPIFIIIIGTLVSSVIPAILLDYLIHARAETLCGIFAFAVSVGAIIFLGY